MCSREHRRRAPGLVDVEAPAVEAEPTPQFELSEGRDHEVLLTSRLSGVTGERVRRERSGKGDLPRVGAREGRGQFRGHAVASSPNASSPMLWRNGVSSHPPTFHAEPKFLVSNVGLGSRPP